MAETKRDRRRESGVPVAAIFLGVAAAKRLAADGEPRPLQAMEKAAEMRAKGASESAIYKATNKIVEGTEYTGITYDAANEPRFEASAKAVKLKGAALKDGAAYLGEVLPRPESAGGLALEGRNLVPVEIGQGTGLTDGTISLDKSYQKTLAGMKWLTSEARGALLHEEQHVGHIIEDRPAGGHPDDFREPMVAIKGGKRIVTKAIPGDDVASQRVREQAYRLLAGEQEAELTRASADMSAGELRNIHPDDRKYPGKVPRDKQLVVYHGQRQAMAKDVEDFGEKIGGARKDNAVKRGPRPKVVDTDTRPGWMKRYVAAPEIRGGNPTGQWMLLDTRKKTRFGAARAASSAFASQAEAERAIPLLAVSQKHYVRSSYPRGADGKYDTTKPQYEIWRKVSDKKQVKAVASTFTSQVDALKYMADNASTLLGTAKGYGEEILAKPEKVMREGPTWRKGDVNPEVFRKEIGYRGVEFGNWQGERSQVLNHAYDAMRDLADITGVKPESLTLNERLALAFGARGHGGKGAARAHYEPMRAAINLTREGGAGTLAHEWWHAADHYLAQLDDPRLGQMAVGPDGTKVLPTADRAMLYASQRMEQVRQGALNEQVRSAYKDLMDTILRKPQEVTVDVGRYERAVQNARASLEQVVKGIRDDLARKLDYGKRNTAPATAEQLAKFDAAAARILKGEALDVEWKFAGDPNARLGSRGSMTFRYQGEALDALSALYKEVRGRTGFDNQGRGGPMDRLAQAMRSTKSALEGLEKAKASPTATVMTMTEFVKNARKLDEARTTPYWQTRHELAARAFTAYIEDKLKAMGRRSDYLSFGSENTLYKVFDEALPFPEGAERQAINAKFEKLFEAMKAAEVVKPVPVPKVNPGWSDEARAASAKKRAAAADAPVKVEDAVKHPGTPIPPKPITGSARASLVDIGSPDAPVKSPNWVDAYRKNGFWHLKGNMWGNGESWMVVTDPATQNKMDAHSGKIGFQNKDTLNAALKAQGKAEAGKAIEKMTMAELKAVAKDHGVAPARSAAMLRNRLREAAKKPDAPKSLIGIVGTSINKLGSVAMIAAPVAAAAVAYDATKSEAQAAGATPADASRQALTNAAIAGGATAGIMAGVGVAAKFALTRLVPAAVAGPAGWALMGGMTAYGAYQAYQQHKAKGLGGTAAALSLVGADQALHLVKRDAGPTRLNAEQAAAYKAANARHEAMQAQKASGNTLRGFQNPANLESAMKSQNKVWDGVYGKKS